MSTHNQKSDRRSRSMTARLSVMAIGAALISGVSTGAETSTPAQKADDNACIFSGTIQDWRALDSRNLVIWAPGRKDAYHVTLSFPLNDLKSVESIAVIDHNGDSRLCGFGMDEIIAKGGAFPERSTVSGMTHLDEAGLVALGEQYKVKLVSPPKNKPVK